MADPTALRDKVAIIGMGCTKFGENYQWGSDDMIIDATFEALNDAKIGLKDIQAAWVGTLGSGTTASGGTGTVLTQPLKLKLIPSTRVENGCATGIEVIRAASMAVALGVYDIALCVGFEQLKDSGLTGLPEHFYHPVYAQGATAPGRWALPATRYFAHHKLTPAQGKEALARISVKNHKNGAKSPKAHLQREITLDQALNAPIIAWPLGLFDCCPTTDGAAAAIICNAKIAKKFSDDYILIKGFGCAVGPAWGKEDIDYKYVDFPETIAAGKSAYEQAGIKDPRKELSMAQIHDCFTIAELMEYEALGFSAPGQAVKDINAGFFELHNGGLPVNTDGGLKSFGHPIGATGIRMVYENYKQLQGNAQLPERQLKNPKLALAMPQSGHPGYFAPVVCILGAQQ